MEINRKFKYGIVAIGSIFLIGLVLNGYIADEKFSSESWKNWEESENTMSLRWNMMDNLLDKHDLKGMTKIQVLELLGEPESKTKTEFGYYLGHSERGINTGRLTIIFENNIVTDFSVWDG